MAAHEPLAAVFCWILLSISVRFRGAEAQTTCLGSLCPGCGTDTITCTATGLTSFPTFSVVDRQQAEFLYLNQNGITALSVDDFAHFTSLRELYISSNNIQTIEPGTFSQATQLTIVDFQGNQLQNLPQSLFTSAPNLTSVDLSDNPVNCDCALRWLPRFLNSSQFTTGALLGTCGALSSLSGVNFIDLTEEQLICDCTQECVNGICDSSVGLCACDDGYTGENCGSACVPGRYGAGCLQNCSCVSENEASPCDPINGACHCLPGYTGLYCQDECPMGFFGQDCAEECLCLNGGLCHPVSGVCTCTDEWSGAHCNISLCSDGVRNNNETGVDCGGVCQPCPAQECGDGSDCEEGQVCVGQYTHPSNLLYPFPEELTYLCVDKDFPGEEILQKFKDALRGREEALADVHPQANLSVVESSVRREIEIQFEIEELLESVTISTLERERGDPLYQASIQWNMNTTDASKERVVQRIISNIDSGLLKGTVLINREDRKVCITLSMERNGTEERIGSLRWVYS